MFSYSNVDLLKGGTPAQIYLEKGVLQWWGLHLLFFDRIIDWCYYTQVTYTGSWEPLVKNIFL